MHAIDKVSLQENVIYHVTVDDFLPTIATGIDLIRQDIGDQVTRDTLEEIAYKLMYAHEAYRFQIR